MGKYFVGLISGTSIDGVDACLARFDSGRCHVERSQTTSYPAELKQRIRQLIETPAAAISELGATDIAIGRFFAGCALELIAAAKLKPPDIAAIGHHGQTIFHHPTGPEAFTMQLGDPNTIAAATGIATAADFRRLDMAYGGQGAPLVPAFHEWVFATEAESRVVLNIGGIANITVLIPGRPTQGFDTGPGNTLLDIAIQRSLGIDYDDRGHWAAGGTVNSGLLGALLQEAYFSLPPPKSTGRELFNAEWLDNRVEAHGVRIEDRDLQSTLAELTAASICDAIAGLPESIDRIVVCGGGAHNDDLLRRIQLRSACPVESSARHGISPDDVEAAAFAWLAAARLENRTGNLPSVTGAKQAAVLGGLYCGKAETSPSILKNRGSSESSSD